MQAASFDDRCRAACESIWRAAVERGATLHLEQYCEVLTPILREYFAPSYAELESLRAIVEKLPRTADGVVVVPGVTFSCPKGHRHTIKGADRFSGRIYCCEGECWDSGCQGDSGSGTHYMSEQCRSAGI